MRLGMKILGLEKSRNRLKSFLFERLSGKNKMKRFLAELQQVRK